MRSKILLVILVSLFLLSNGMATNCFSENGDSRIVIKAVITNLKDIKEHIKSYTFLQLIHIPTSGDMTGKISDNHRLIWDSNLPKIPVPSDGIVLFKLKNLKPGTYKLFLQDFQTVPIGGKPPVDGEIAKGDKYLRIIIPEHAEMPFAFDCGEVYVRQP